MIFQRKQKKSQHEDIVLRNAILVLSERLDKLKDSYHHRSQQKRQSTIDRFESISKKRDIARYEISCLIRGIISETKELKDDETSSNIEFVNDIIRVLKIGRPPRAEASR